ncbi:hypothetical protein, partial [Nostoc linckia]
MASPRGKEKGKRGKGKGERERGKGLVFSLSPIKMHPFDHKSAKRIECKRSDVFETFTLSLFPFTLYPFPFPLYPF